MENKTRKLAILCERFFTPEEFAALPEHVKHHLSKIPQNYELLKSVGLIPETSECKLLEVDSKVELDSLSVCGNSDLEWTPALEAIPPGGERMKTKVSSVLCQPDKNKEKFTLKEVDTQDRTSLPCFQPNYALEEDHSDSDESLFSQESNIKQIKECIEPGSLNVSDSQVPPDCIRGKDKDYCRKTLPPGLAIKTSDMPDAWLGIFAKRFFPAQTIFGPYVGKNKSIEQMAPDSKYCWQIFKDGSPSHCIDGSDTSDSNWMRFINFARCEDEQYVTAYQHQGEIFYRAHRDIPAGTEILVNYDDSYARDLGIQAERANAASVNSLPNIGNNNNES
ncbi:histone-lysine N-methyltransferase PRDM7-like [Physella acuta]|uniref:histone-lysine N-methyltransferase PRDM7-like n=1 Tax=Physella acuta TaxID=109671 RepID=UPI0027DC0B4C|nr:histone-lysine N-methyltransferase PRDM7-like [Physella acuta]XP_059165084.1 histone-lysine N-methyltransferase PRDM7-like [Physella acuta]